MINTAPNEIFFDQPIGDPDVVLAAGVAKRNRNNIILKEKKNQNNRPRTQIYGRKKSEIFNENTKIKCFIDYFLSNQNQKLNCSSIFPSNSNRTADLIDWLTELTDLIDLIDPIYWFNELTDLIDWFNEPTRIYQKICRIVNLTGYPKATQALPPLGRVFFGSLLKSVIIFSTRNGIC